MNNAVYSVRYAPRKNTDAVFGIPGLLLKIGITCPECGAETITEDHPSVTGNLSCFRCGRKLSDELCRIFWDSLPKTVRRQSNG